MTDHKQNSAVRGVGSTDGLERKGWLKKQMDASAKEIRKLKRTTPYIFQEHQDLLFAAGEYTAAKKRYEEAKRLWRNLGRK